MNYTPRSQNVLHHAERIAREHGHNHVGTEHLILALLAEPRGIAGQVLARLGVTTSVAAMTEEIMASPGYRTGSGRMITFFVDDAERTPGGWLVRGEVGLGPPEVGDEFSFVHHQDVDQEDRLTLRVERLDGAVLWLAADQDVDLRRGDILSGEVER